MYIPMEFADYLNSAEPLTRKEQEERLIHMYTDEIIKRAKMMRELNYDKATTSSRIKKNFEWAFEFGEQHASTKSVDKIVDDVFANHKPQF